MPASTALVCTGTALANEQLVQQAQQYLSNEYSLQATYAKDAFSRTTPAQRAQIFCDYLFNPAIEHIMLLRGGEGTADIIPYIHQHAAKIKQLNPKNMIGFSDFTPALIYFAQQYGWPVIHGVGIHRVNNHEINQQSIKLTFDWLQQKTNHILLDHLQPLNTAAHQQRDIQATLIGGTLSLLTISIKDIWELDTRHKILIIEDVHEKPHQILRALKYLQRIGKLEDVEAIIFGDFNTHPVGKTEAEQINNSHLTDRSLRWFANQCHVPVLKTDLFGHGSCNYPLPFATGATLQLGSRPSLCIRR